MDDQNINCLRADNRFGTEVFSPYTPPKSMKREGGPNEEQRGERGEGDLS